MEQTATPEKCIKCGREEDVNHYWLYIWKGISGNTCKDCGTEIHNIGYYLLEKAAEIFTKNGIIVECTKEKFGQFRIYSITSSKEHERIVQETLMFYQQSYPEFEWDF